MTTIGWLRLALSLSGLLVFVFLVRLFGVSGPNEQWPWHLLALVLSGGTTAVLLLVQRRLRPVRNIGTETQR